MRKDYTHISILVDSSGSMHELKDDTIGGFNSLIDDQKLEEGKASISFYQFSGSCKSHYLFKDVKEIKPLTRNDYITYGSTALYDSLAKVINETGKTLANMKESERPSKVLIISITDGEENSSRMTSELIKSKIEHQQEKYNWEFVFVGSNQDAVLNAKKIGIPLNHAYTYANTSEGMLGTYRNISANVSKSRKGFEMNFNK